jgi:hypothetical protein
MNAANIATALGDARREGRAWRCRCPLHGGRSLLMRDGEGGRVLVKCWAGCSPLDVLSEPRRRGLLDAPANYSPHLSVRRHVGGASRRRSHSRSGMQQGTVASRLHAPI